MRRSDSSDSVRTAFFKMPPLEASTAAGASSSSGRYGSGGAARPSPTRSWARWSSHRQQTRRPSRVEYYDPERPSAPYSSSSSSRLGGGARRRPHGSGDATPGEAAPSRPRPALGGASLIPVCIAAALVFSLQAALSEGGGGFGLFGFSSSVLGLRPAEDGTVSFRRYLAETNNDDYDNGNAKYTRGPSDAALAAARRAAELDGRYLKRSVGGGGGSGTGSAGPVADEGEGEGEGDGDPSALFRTVHTFFSPIDPHTRLPTDKLNATDRIMLDTWRSAWESQGWKTKILTIADARRHPDYPSYDRGLDEVPLGANAYYNRLCFLRWMAMAAAGGGFMSDFDVVPLRPPPAGEGAAVVPPKFAVYGSGVPTLLSGTADEWDRMARLLLRKARSLNREQPRNLWSDMLVLQELRLPLDENYLMRHETLSGLEALKRSELTSDDCAFFRSDGHRREGGFRAAHFSHFDMKEAFKAGYLQQGGAGEAGTKRVDYNDRPRVMREFMEKWSKQCKGKELHLEVADLPAATAKEEPKEEGAAGGQQEGKEAEAGPTPNRAEETPQERPQAVPRAEVKQ